MDPWSEQLGRQRRAKDEAFRTDPGSPIMPGDRRSFKGLAYFPPDPRYRFEVDLVEETPKRLDIQRSGGDVVVYVRRGHFRLQLPDGPVKLAFYESDGHGFVPFRDKTSGKETYGAGRYLDPTQTHDGRYVVDLNEAYNPFCAYNESYSCPFPPPENWLQVPVPVGEKTYETH